MGDTDEAEDVLKEGFIQACAHSDDFAGRSGLGTWLHRIVVNRAIAWTRSRRLRGEVELSAALPARRSEPELAGATMQALARLSPEHRAVLVMRYVLELTPGEIAKALDLPLGTVKTRTRSALARVARALE